MATSALVSTAVTGVVLLAIIVAVLRVREWRDPTPATEDGLANLARSANGPLGWSVTFFVVTFGVMGLAVLYAVGAPVAGVTHATVGLMLVTVIAAVFVGASLVAVYAASRGRGLNSAQAAGLSSALLGVLFVVAVVVQLFVGG